MGAGRVLGTCLSVAAVAGCALLVAGMSSAGSGTEPTDTPFAMPTVAARVYTDAQWSAAASTTSAGSTSTASTVTPAAPRVAHPTSSAAAPEPSASARLIPHPPTSASTTRTAATPTAKPATSSAPAPVRGQSLPVSGSTSGATRVITVLASSYASTTATVQAWDRAPGGGWLKRGTGIPAHVGSQGLTHYPSESKSATPIGSFTLTQAFGWKSNPGTGLPYFTTNSADWWISQSGPLYNTHQHCSSGCAFTRGDPNEHLSAIGVYAEAVVIDYNTRNSPTGVRQGKGSAFFLHVTDGSATAGCVAIPESNLVRIMRWLTPSAHPRILIGVTG